MFRNSASISRFERLVYSVAIMGRNIRNVPVQDGDSFVFVAIERNTKLVLNVAIGKCDQGTTNAFMEAVRNAIAPGRFQITRDGFAPYKTAIPDTFGSRVDFAMSVKVYRAAAEGERKYSPPEVVSTEVVLDYRQSHSDRIGTSTIERSNLSLRMGTRRFTRLSNAFFRLSSGRKFHQPDRVRDLEHAPALRHVEHVLQQAKLPIHGCRSDFAHAVGLMIFHPKRGDVVQRCRCEKSLKSSVHLNVPGAFVRPGVSAITLP